MADKYFELLYYEEIASYIILGILVLVFIIGVIKNS